MQIHSFHSNFPSLVASTKHIQQCVNVLTKRTEFLEPNHIEPYVVASEPMMLSEPILPKKHGLDLNSFEHYLSTCAQFVGLNPHHWMAVKTEHSMMECISGPVVSRYWSLRGQKNYKTMGTSEAYALFLAAQSTRIFQRRLSMSWFLTYNWVHILKFNLQFSVQCTRLFTFGGLHHVAIQKGDIHHLRHQFSIRKLGVNDVTSQGDTLLHVSLEPQIEKHKC